MLPSAASHGQKDGAAAATVLPRSASTSRGYETAQWPLCVVFAGLLSRVSELHWDTRSNICDASERLAIRPSSEIRVQVAAIGVSSAAT